MAQYSKSKLLSYALIVIGVGVLAVYGGYALRAAKGLTTRIDLSSAEVHTQTLKELQYVRVANANPDFDNVVTLVANPRSYQMRFVPLKQVDNSSDRVVLVGFGEDDPFPASDIYGLVEYAPIGVFDDEEHRAKLSESHDLNKAIFINFGVVPPSTMAIIFWNLVGLLMLVGGLILIKSKPAEQGVAPNA